MEQEWMPDEGRVWHRLNKELEWRDPKLHFVYAYCGDRYDITEDDTVVVPVAQGMRCHLCLKLAPEEG